MKSTQDGGSKKAKEGGPHLAAGLALEEAKVHALPAVHAAQLVELRLRQLLDGDVDVGQHLGSERVGACENEMCVCVCVCVCACARLYGVGRRRGPASLVPGWTRRRPGRSPPARGPWCRVTCRAVCVLVGGRVGRRHKEGSEGAGERGRGRAGRPYKEGREGAGNGGREGWREGGMRWRRGRPL
jgi:hypothetical protein